MLDRRIGAQLYTVRDLCQTYDDMDKCFEKISAIGYKTVQVSGVGPLKGREVKELCDKHGLEPIVTHRGIGEYFNNIDELITYHKELGCKICGLGWIPTEYRKTPEDLKAFISAMNKVVEKLNENGLEFAYHNHSFEFMKLGGKYIMDMLLEETNFDFIVDVYWVAYSGIDPARFIAKLGKRAKLLHFKDLAIREEKTCMCEVMEGNLDFDSIIAASDEAGSMAAFVEQDTCDKDPIESLAISYRNLKTKGFN